MAFHIINCIFFLVIVLSGARDVFSDTLKAEFASAKLPTPRAFAQPIYDGYDSIYLFGGYYLREILRYNISSDSIEEIGELPSGGVTGSVQRIEKDNQIYYYYFGSLSSSNPGDISEFNPRTNSAINVAIMPASTYTNVFNTFKQNNSHIVYALIPIDELRSNLYECDMLTYTNKTVTEPIPFRGYTSVVLDNKAYAFGYESKVLKMDIESLDIEILSNAPAFSHYSYVASHGLNAYLIGGYDETTETMGDYLLQFNLATEEWASIDVENFPYKGDIPYRYGPTTVFVEKLNRIYYFGGWLRNGTVSSEVDDIWYIDLPMKSTDPSTTTPSSPVFSCLDKPDGMYPNPSDCSKFVWCKDGLSTDMDCTPPLLFDPLTGRCDHPDVVVCEASCVGKPDGQYPYPRDCSKFILCHEEVLSIYECTPPLLFDPELFICNDPEIVDCQVA